MLIDDANLDSRTVLLNDQPVAAELTIETPGSYRLQVIATDLAGNRSERQWLFSVTTPPADPELSVNIETDRPVYQGWG